MMTPDSRLILINLNIQFFLDLGGYSRRIDILIQIRVLHHTIGLSAECRCMINCPRYSETYIRSADHTRRNQLSNLPSLRGRDCSRLISAPFPQANMPCQLTSLGTSFPLIDVDGSVIRPRHGRSGSSSPFFLFDLLLSLDVEVRTIVRVISSHIPISQNDPHGVGQLERTYVRSAPVA